MLPIKTCPDLLLLHKIFLPLNPFYLKNILLLLSEDHNFLITRFTTPHLKYFT